MNETEDCDLPDSYNVTVKFSDKNKTMQFSVKPKQFMANNGFYRQNISVNIPVSGQPTEVVSVLEPENCIGTSTSETVKSSK